VNTEQPINVLVLSKITWTLGHVDSVPVTFGSWVSIFSILK